MGVPEKKLVLGEGQRRAALCIRRWLPNATVQLVVRLTSSPGSLCNSSLLLHRPTDHGQLCRRFGIVPLLTLYLCAEDGLCSLVLSAVLTMLMVVVVVVVISFSGKCSGNCEGFGPVTGREAVG